jgi:creatinine amidohydrolase
MHPVPKGFVPASGVLAVAHGSTAEKGQWLMDDYVAGITAAVRKEFNL